MAYETANIVQQLRQPNYQTFQSTQHFGSLNGLRFLCIFAVLWHHSPIVPLVPDGLTVLKRGFLGVDFFFVLSGFLITTLLLREDGRNGTFSIRGFYWRRILRIVPVYFLVVTVVSTYFILVKGEMQYLELLPFYYLFMSNFLTDQIPMLGITWSLSVEEQYYMIWPLMLMLVPRRFILPVLIGLIAINLVAVSGGLRSLGIYPVEIGPLVIKMFTATYAPILIGSALAIILNGKAGFVIICKVLGSRYAAPCAFGFLLILIQSLPQDITGWPNLMLHLTMGACLASIVVREDHALQGFFRQRLVSRIGEISYGIYLYHLIGLHICLAVLTPFNLHGGWSAFFLYSAISIAIAELSFRYYERPFLRMRYGRSGA